MSRVHVSESSVGGWHALRLENEVLCVIVLPGKGAEIYAVIDRASGIDLLWKAPWALRPHALATATAGSSQAAWMDHYVGGWQVLFPNAGDAVTYRGADLSFHGEASVAPWEWRVVSTDDGPVIELTADLMRSPFRISRRMRMEDNRATFSFSETITNTGTTAMPYMWGHHPAFGAPFLCEGAKLTAPARTYVADVANGPGATRITPRARAPWPQAVGADGGTVDLSVIPGPESRTADMGYMLDFASGWYAIDSPATGLGVAVAWPRDIMPSVWLWQEFCGGTDYPWYGRAYVMGVEPHTSWPGHGLLGAIEAGTARTLEAGASETVTLAMTVYQHRDGIGPVTDVTADGTIAFG